MKNGVPTLGPPPVTERSRPVRGEFIGSSAASRFSSASFIRLNEPYGDGRGVWREGRGTEDGVWGVGKGKRGR